jgi:hypothetical protein
MRSSIFSSVKVALVVAFLAGSTASNAQQNVIANKDNTRPEITRQFSLPANISFFSVVRNNGYNDIQWASQYEQDTRKFIVEYSLDGIYFQSAGEVLATPTGNYQLKHQTFERSPLLYRIRAENLNGRFVYSRNILLSGDDVSPVKIYPTIITGNQVNINAAFPIERITVVSISGQQVYTQDVSGRTDYMTVTLPSLGKGIYIVNFSGQGWKWSDKIIVP